jgi:hypothetical protein
VTLTTTKRSTTHVVSERKAVVVKEESTRVKWRDGREVEVREREARYYSRR